jgi:hypothetical protein
VVVQRLDGRTHFIGKLGDLPVHPSVIQPADEPHRRGSAAAIKNSAGREKSNLTDSDFPLVFTFFLGEIGQNQSIIKCRIQLVPPHFAEIRRILEL